MAVSSQINETRFGELAEALRQEIQTGPTDATKSIRVRHGIYSLRGKAGQYIIRIRIPAGVLTTEQLETVAALTEQSGWEAGAHLTTRQGIEIAGLPAVEIPAALEKLDATGLTTLRTGGPFVRGVVACPFSGVARDEIFDVTPFALAVDRYFREHADFQKLPRKIKISFEGCAHDHVRTLVSDIGVRAVRRDGAKGISHHASAAGLVPRRKPHWCWKNSCRLKNCLAHSKLFCAYSTNMAIAIIAPAPG